MQWLWVTIGLVFSFFSQLSSICAGTLILWLLLISQRFVLTLWWSVFLSLLAAAVISRFHDNYHLEENFRTNLLKRFYDVWGSGRVCWDEAHFGKFAGWSEQSLIIFLYCKNPGCLSLLQFQLKIFRYINRTNFFDVHPPLGKLIIAGFGNICPFWVFNMISQAKYLVTMPASTSRCQATLLKIFQPSWACALDALPLG